MAASKPTSGLFSIKNDVYDIEYTLRDLNYGLGCFPFGHGGYPTCPNPKSTIEYSEFNITARTLVPNDEISISTPLSIINLSPTYR